MPMKAKRPCRHPGCAKLVSDRSGYCEEHKKERARQYERYERDRETAARYGWTWRKVRKAYLAAHPLCEMCRSEGRYRAAEEVHHKKPLAAGGTHEADNLAALCKSCHSRITARESYRGKLD